MFLVFSCLFALGLACRLGLRFGCNIDDDPPAVAAALRARAMGHARSPALADGELLGLKRVMRPAVSRVRSRVSHADYHALYIANKR